LPSLDSSIPQLLAGTPRLRQNPTTSSTRKPTTAQSAGCTRFLKKAEKRV